MPIKEKLKMKVPPHKDYCPVCNNKVDSGAWTTSKTVVNTEYHVAHKCCSACGATWDVQYRLIPVKLMNIHVCTEFEDVKFGD